MVINLLIGFPGDRPGGLVLTIIYFVASGLAAIIAGFAYAAAGVALARASLPLQAASAVLRGIPLSSCSCFCLLMCPGCPSVAPVSLLSSFTPFLM